MENYNLQPDEVILYKGHGYVSNNNAEIMLTNYNIMIDIKKMKLFTKQEIVNERYSIEDIKIYNEDPQLKQKNSTVEIHLKNGEKSIGFPTKGEANKFINEIRCLITGKTATERGAEKIKSAINLVDNTLGINTVETIKDVFDKGVVGTLLGGKVKNKSRNNKAIGFVKNALNVTKEVLIDSNEDSEKSQDDSDLEKIKKLKELLDIGAISQEEFDEKKKEFLGL